MDPDGGRFEPGIYELPLTHHVNEVLADIDRSLVTTRKLNSAEAPDRVALHLRQAIERSLSSIPEARRVDVAIQITADVLAALQAHSKTVNVAGEVLASPAEVLEAISRPNPDGSPNLVSKPLVSVLDTTILTNAQNEPRASSQVRAEIASADRIDVLVAFIRRSGLRPLLGELQRHCEAGKPLRILTTTYTGSTEQAALDQLVSLGAEVKVSYDETSTRLHAKAWLFERRSGYSTAYVGSSNLTDMALNDGLEWNVRIAAARNPDVVDKITAVFESYWMNEDFRPYDAAEFARHAAQHESETSSGFISPLEITPRPFQTRILELVELSRDQGFHRNLIVAATGTGKTVMAALDYARLAETLPRARLLFIAHREEILDQSRAIFQQAMGDSAFGEKWVGGSRPQHFNHVFASIQSLSKSDLTTFDPEHFDVVIIDEFHHTAANSYKKVLEHIRPLELLGLTATPERADGASILEWFDQRIAAELRLWDAIDQGLLSPFRYYGINDGLDLEDVPWKRGIGYDPIALTGVITGNDLWVNRVIHEFADRVDDLENVRALGFCVTVEHAKFMAARFNAAGIPAAAVSGLSSSEDRRSALRGLRDGTLRVLFSVDIFNEGVDIPSVDAVLMLRPTESATVFIQQLGRGLRRHRAKEYCLVLDFVGHHRKEFRFDLKFRALLGGSRKDLEEQIKSGFPYLPSGCHMELDPIAQVTILESLKTAIPSNLRQRAAELKSLHESGQARTLREFLEESSLDLDDIYSGNRSWSDLLEAAGIETLAGGPQESSLRRAIGRLLHVNDPLRIREWRKFLRGPQPTSNAESEFEQRLQRMLLSQLFSAYAKDSRLDSMSRDEAAAILWDHPQVQSELLELLDVLESRIDHLQTSLPSRTENPVRVHGRYTRGEILAGFAEGNRIEFPSWREGVRFIESDGIGTDLFVVTLDKSNGAFLPTTMYKDFAMSPDVFHWESQSTTPDSSPTGVRYQTHVELGTEVILFARLSESDRSFWCLGRATYISHEGSRPMAIKWRLDNALPGDLFAQFAAAVA